MKILTSRWPSSRLPLAGITLLGAVLTGCQTPDPSDPSSSSSVTSVSSNGSSSSSPVVTDPNPPVIPQDYDHCIDGFRPHPTDGLISDGGTRHERNGEIDVSVDPVVFNYMYDNGWQDAHVLWHQARTCGGFGGAGFGINDLPSACSFPELLPTQNDCQGDENGLEFLAAHSIMMYQLRELWPSHTEQFSGWETFPRTAEDYPPEMRDRFKGWSQEILEAADIGDNIEQHIDKFANDGEFGTWVSCAIMPGATSSGVGTGGFGGGFGGFGGAGGADFSIQRNLHFALHDQAAPIRNQKHAVNNNNQNIDAYLFWKLHSWIDHVWRRYREAKNLPNHDQNFKDIMVDQCREMDEWRKIGMETRGADGHPNQDEKVYIEVPEAGFFHENVRPAFESAGCSSCHGEGEEAGLRLGYEISSTEIVERLVNHESHYTEGYNLVVPGNPDQSWLYLKASGESQNRDVQCKGISSGCNSHMPGLSAEQLENLRKWIADGAQLPTIL